jgi:hypothetical protein
LLVIDNKTGWTLPPPIAVNWQLRSEGALLSELHDAEETVVAIIHPHHPDSLWEAKMYPRKAMADLLDTTRKLVKTIQLPSQPRTPGGVQCQWCMAKRVCPEYKAWQATLDQSVADEVQDQGFTAINRRTKEERGEHVRALREQEKNIAFILEQYTELAVRDPNAITGYALRRKLTPYLTNEMTAIELVKNAYGQETLGAALKFNLVALREQLALKHGPTKAKEMVNTLLASVLRYKKSKHFLEESRSL